MYVRWKHRSLRRSGDTAWDAMLVRSIWVAGRPRQKVVGYLASIRAQYHHATAHRAWFWTRVEARLNMLGLEASTRQGVEAQLQHVIPRPTAEELQHLATQRAVFAVANRLCASDDSCSAYNADTWPDDGHYTPPGISSGEGGSG